MSKLAGKNTVANVSHDHPIAFILRSGDKGIAPLGHWVTKSILRDYAPSYRKGLLLQ